MAKLVHQRVGGQAIHVGDCEVWAGIFYLDSPTDYREFLPENCPISCQENLAILGEPSGQGNLGNFSWLLSILLLLGFVLYLTLSRVIEPKGWLDIFPNYFG